MFRKLNSSNNNGNNQGAAQSIDNNNDRPRIQVKPRGIGPITSLHQNDVLCGRGGRINGHAGNIQFRNICGEKRDEYFAKSIKKIEKAHIAASVVERIRGMSPPGRFLKQDTRSGHWYDIGCAKAMTKVGQAIREYTIKEEDETSSQNLDGILGTAGVVNGTFSKETLYPGYNPNEIDGIDQPQQQSVMPVTPAYQQPTESAFQNSIANYYATNMNDSQVFDSTPQEDHRINVGPNDRNMRSSCGFSSLLRESILSDMSDCEFVMGLGDDMDMTNYCPADVGKDSLVLQAGLDAGLYTAPLATSTSTDPVNTTQGSGEMAPNAENDNAPRANKRRRQEELRRSSMMSIASTVSVLSLCSVATWGAF